MIYRAFWASGRIALLIVCATAVTAVSLGADVLFVMHRAVTTLDREQGIAVTDPPDAGRRLGNQK